MQNLILRTFYSWVFFDLSLRSQVIVSERFKAWPKQVVELPELTTWPISWLAEVLSPPQVGISHPTSLINFYFPPPPCLLLIINTLTPGKYDLKNTFFCLLKIGIGGVGSNPTAAIYNFYIVPHTHRFAKYNSFFPFLLIFFYSFAPMNDNRSC